MLAARPGAAARGEALQRLCTLYWPPVFAHLRRRGLAATDAEDMTQAFFAHVLAGEFFSRPDPARGRFRSFLLGALEHFWADERDRQRAQRRGGGRVVLSWDETRAGDVEDLLASGDADPAAAFEAQWARSLLQSALVRLRGEQEAAGRGEVFRVLEPFLGAPPEPGDYEEAARRLGTTKGTVAVWAHRLSQRFAECVRREVAATVADPAEVAGELRHLENVLRR